MSAEITVITGPAVALAKRFGKAVVERWTRYRAEQFFQAFVEALGFETMSASESKEVDERLAAMLEDETKSQVLFDAYRRVCFSTSKRLGPQIVGLLTGRLVLEGRMADPTEESVFAAAESLSDGDLLDFMKSYHEYRGKAQGVTDFQAEHHMVGKSVVVRWYAESANPDGLSGSDLEIGPLDWDAALGRWAAKLRQTGLITERVQQRFGRPWASRQALSSASVVVTITFEPGCARLYELLARSLGLGKSK